MRALAALLVVLTQQLAGFSIDQMDPGAGRTIDRLVFVFGNIWIVIQLVLDVQAGCRASENEVAHLSELLRRLRPPRRDPSGHLGNHLGFTSFP